MKQSFCHVREGCRAWMIQSFGNEAVGNFFFISLVEAFSGFWMKNEKRRWNYCKAAGMIYDRISDKCSVMVLMPI